MNYLNLDLTENQYKLLCEHLMDLAIKDPTKPPIICFQPNRKSKYRGASHYFQLLLLPGYFEIPNPL